MKMICVCGQDEQGNVIYLCGAHSTYLREYVRDRVAVLTEEHKIEIHNMNQTLLKYAKKLAEKGL